MKGTREIGLLLALMLLSGCVSPGYEMVSYMRMVSTNSKFSSRELRGEVENVIYDMGYSEGLHGKWTRSGKSEYILVEGNGSSQPTIDVSVYVKQDKDRGKTAVQGSSKKSTQKNTVENSKKKNEVILALHSHFSRRMTRGEVKLLKAVY